MRRVAVFVTMLACACAGCGERARRAEEPSAPEPPLPLESVAESAAKPTADLSAIRARGRLIAITAYSATSYFIYKGQPMGYEYDLISRLAKDLGLGLELVIAKDIDSILDMLVAGEGDIVAYGLAVTRGRSEAVRFTEHHNLTRQVLVQRKPANWRKMKRHEINRKLIRNQVDLIGKKVHVRKATSYFARLKNLSDEIGGHILVIPVPGDITTDELIRQVAEGEIDYTVADESIARINSTYYANIDIETPVSFPQRIAWAVRPDAPELLEAVNDWISVMRKEGDGAIIYSKYFKNPRAFKRRAQSAYFVNGEGGRISEFDEYLQERAAWLGWDWRLLASLVYQESRFEPECESWAGAVGLMQLMPETGDLYDAFDLTDPYDNIRAGTEYLRWIWEQFADVPDDDQRLRFVLASYNAGKGHVDDAQRLARKHGHDPFRWKGSVARWMTALSKGRYFNDEVVKYGYCRGENVVAYVREILDRYNHYKNFIDAEG